MTLILGVEYNNKVYMAGDRFAGNEQSYFVCDTPKIVNRKKNFKKKTYNIGFAYCGDFVCSHFLNKMSLLRNDNAKSIDEWARFTLRNLLIEQFDVHNLLGPNCDSSILIGVNGKMYGFFNGNSIIRNNDGFLASGMGEQGALAVWSAVKDVKEWTIKEKLYKVMEASEKYCPMIKKPFDIMEIK